MSGEWEWEDGRMQPRQTEPKPKKCRRCKGYGAVRKGGGFIPVTWIKCPDCARKAQEPETPERARGER